jgi:type IV secretory pathway VirB10-like protein
MYKIFMLIALPALAIAWIAYALWMRKVREEEKKQPKPTSERLQKTKSEVVDWAKKMAQFQPPKHKPPPPPPPGQT